MTGFFVRGGGGEGVADLWNAGKKPFFFIDVFPKCPAELGKYENEEDFDDIECHISDGIDMGCQENVTKGMVPDDIFRIERTGDQLVRGTECYERAILPKKAMRKSLLECVDMDFNKQSIKAALHEIGLQPDNPRCVAIKNLLEFVGSKSRVDDCYRELLTELAKDSPISIWLPGLESQSFVTLRSFLICERNIFEHPHESFELHQNFPYISNMISQLRKSNVGPFLPHEVSQVFLSMMSLLEDFQAISYERAVKRTRPHERYKPCEAECYPNNPEHTIENQYLADTMRDKTEDKRCGKYYNSKATITGGLTHLSCHHGIVKGFTALQRGESPLLIVGPAMRRLPSRVKAKRRFFIYDNACAAHKSCLRRFPHRIRNWTFLVDRTHRKNHTACHLLQVMFFSTEICFQENPARKYKIGTGEIYTEKSDS